MLMKTGWLNVLNRPPGLESWNSWWKATTGCCSRLTPWGRYRLGKRSWLLRLGLVLFWKAARRLELGLQFWEQFFLFSADFLGTEWLERNADAVSGQMFSLNSANSSL